jgi:pilus assembly protein Flp/PilA
MIKMIKCLKNDTRGATALEYGLIVSLVVIAMFSGLSSFATAGTSLLETVKTKIVG